MTWALIVVFLNANTIWDTGIRTDSLEQCAEIRTTTIQQYRQNGQDVSGSFQCVPSDTAMK